MPCRKIVVTFVYNFALGKFDFRGQWSATPKNRGRSKKMQGRRALKTGGASLAVGSYLQRGSAPPPGADVLGRGGGLITGDRDDLAHSSHSKET